MALKISSVNQNDPQAPDYLPLRDFEGIYTISDFDSDSKEISIDPEDKGVYADMLINPDKNLKVIEGLDIIEEIQPGTSASELINHEILNLGARSDFKFSNLLSKETVIDRKAIFIGRICLTDALEIQKLAKTSFRVFLQKPRECLLRDPGDPSICKDDPDDPLKGTLRRTFC